MGSTTFGRSLLDSTFAVVMAGGSGTRLGELTRRHAKPALPFGGQYRNIDFTLSNCVNSGLKRISVLTQYNAHSLIQHVQCGWSFLPAETGEFVQVWPAHQRPGGGWYRGTADAVYQNLDLLAEHRLRRVLVLAGDHVYRMDYGPMLEAHEAGADVTIGCVDVPLEEASAFGVLGVDEAGWVRTFEEKPARPAPLPGDARKCRVSMGIYVFDYARLVELLEADAADAGSSHDFGRDVLPRVVHEGKVLSYSLPAAPGREPYWRDVGTVDGYWRAHMELLGPQPGLDLHDPAWPIWTHQTQCPPPRFVEQGAALRSIVAAGSTVAGRVERSVLSTRCRVAADSRIEESVLLAGVAVGRGCRLRNVIVDEGCEVPDGTVIGYDRDDDSSRFEVTAGGITLVTQARLARSRRPARARRCSDADVQRGRFPSGEAPRRSPITPAGAWTAAVEPGRPDPR